MLQTSWVASLQASLTSYVRNTQLRMQLRFESRQWEIERKPNTRVTKFYQNRMCLSPLTPGPLILLISHLNLIITTAQKRDRRCNQPSATGYKTSIPPISHLSHFPRDHARLPSLSTNPAIHPAPPTTNSSTPSPSFPVQDARLPVLGGPHPKNTPSLLPHSPLRTTEAQTPRPLTPYLYYLPE